MSNRGMEFDDNNLWHKNAHLMFGFQCVTCDAKIGESDTEDADLDKNFLGFCVDVAKRAQELGWECKGDFSFSCPNCSNK